MTRPIRLEGDLRDFAIVRPIGGDSFRSLGTGIMEQNHVGMLGARLVEHRPNADMAVAIRAAGESDARAGWHEHLRVSEFPGVEKIPAVDHRRGQRPMIDERSRARAPGGAGLGRIEFAEMISEEFESVAPFGQREPLRDQAFECDRADFRAVLLGVGSPLRRFIVVEIATDSLRLAVEEVDKRPKEVGKIRFETRVSEEARESLDDGFECERCGVRRGQGTRIGLVLEGAITVQGEFVEKIGRGCSLIVIQRLGIEGKGSELVIHGGRSLLEAALLAA